MNKRTIILAVLIVIALSVGIFFWTKPAPMNMERVFPSEALMYGRLSHVEHGLDLFAKSDFWKGVSVIDVPKVLEHNGIVPREAKHLQKMQKEIVPLLNNPLTKKFLGTELAVGVYETAANAKNILDPYEVIFATRLGFSLQMAELFASMGRQWSDEISTTNEEYSGARITHVHFIKRKLDLQYTRIHDILLISFFPSNILHQVIDVHQGKHPPLAADASFSRSYSQVYPKGQAIFFVNIQKFVDLIKKGVSEEQSNDFQRMFKSSSGFESYTVSFLNLGDTSKIKMIIPFQESQLNPYLHSFFSCSGSANPSLKFVPHDVMAYYWGQCYDFKALWGEAKENLQMSPSTKENIGKFKHRLEKRFKLKIYDDVLPILGSQVGWYLNDIDTQGLFPYPRGIAFVKIENREAAEKLMEKVARKSYLLMQDEEYEKSTIHYMTLPLGANMDPGYAFLGDYLLLGSSKETLKTSIDAFTNPNQSLESSETLKQFSINTSDTNQGVTFAKVDDISKRLQQLLDWYNKVVSSQITAALAYQQEIKVRQKELVENLGFKKDELKVAQNKLDSLQAKTATEGEMTAEDKSNLEDTIAHLTADMKTLQDDIDSFSADQQKLSQAFMTYQAQAKASKAWLFNSDEVLMPFLKAMESLHALGMKWYLNDHRSEMEIFVK